MKQEHDIENVKESDFLNDDLVDGIEDFERKKTLAPTTNVRCVEGR